MKTILTILREADPADLLADFICCAALFVILVVCLFVAAILSPTIPF